MADLLISVVIESEQGSELYIEATLLPPEGTSATAGPFQRVPQWGQIVIGNGEPEDWSIVGGPPIRTQNGRDTLIISGKDEQNEMIMFPGESAEEFARRNPRFHVVKAEIDIGRQPGPYERQMGCRSGAPISIEIPPEGRVDHVLGRTPDGRECILVIQLFKPRRFEQERPSLERM